MTCLVPNYVGHFNSPRVPKDAAPAVLDAQGQTALALVASNEALRLGPQNHFSNVACSLAPAQASLGEPSPTSTRPSIPGRARPSRR